MKLKLNKYILFGALITGLVFMFFLYQIQSLQIQNQFSKLTPDELVTLVDNNQNTWKTYLDSDQETSFKYPFYLSDFRDLSADTQLAKSDEKVASYKGGDRSLWVILSDVYPNTKRLDIQEWIIKNRINFVIDDIGNTEKLEIQQMMLGGRKSFSIDFISNEGGARNSKVYFQTTDGIRSIGFHSFSVSNSSIADYKIFKQILSTFSFQK